jgi:hypothetical protein
MMPRTIVTVVLALAVSAACGSSSRVTVAQQPATVESIPGTNQVRIHLTALAAHRLGIKTARVQLTPAPPPSTAVAPAATGGPAVGSPDTEPHPTTPATPLPPTTGPLTTPAPFPRLVIPVAAVLYQPTGAAYAYINTAPLTYIRRPLAIAYIVGDTAVLVAGPPAGTAVVVVGGAELTGIETGVGQE